MEGNENSKMFQQGIGTVFSGVDAIPELERTLDVALAQCVSRFLTHGQVEKS